MRLNKNHGILIILLVVNISSIFITSSIIDQSAIGGSKCPPLTREMLDLAKDHDLVDVISNEDTLSNTYNLVEIDNLKPPFSIHNSTVISNQSDDKNTDFITYITNIWNDTLGSDSIVLSNPASYMNGLIISNNSIGSYFTDSQDLSDELDEVNNSLFVRIGNIGYKTTFNPNLDDEILNGISAGWQIKFPIIDDYDLVNISFKWRFDARDDAFDNDTYFPPAGISPDETTDYQEIRARIISPLNDPDESFWLNSPSTDNNPNGTVFYRFGPDVIGDEEWQSFNYSFHVSKNTTHNYTLELGTYLNTREDRLEFFDVWFDDIEIIGVTNHTDMIPPQPVVTGLSETVNISRFEFWANFSEGIWSSPIENVTVYYNQTGFVTNASMNVSMSLVEGTINIAGYNQTYWNLYENFNFGDNISYFFEIYDTAYNSYSSSIQEKRIGDFLPPIINSTNEDYSQLLGNGTVIISIEVYDWGNATEFVILNYLIDGVSNESIMTYNSTHYVANVFVPYGKEMEYTFFLNDTEGNYNNITVKNPVLSTVDEVDPSVTDFEVYLDDKKEGKAYINVTAIDSFGEVDKIYLRVTDPVTSNSTNYIMTYDNDTGVYRISQGLDLNYGVNYTMKVTVHDKAGNNNSINNRDYSYVMRDEIAPKIPVIETEYLIPGKLTIKVSISDEGSGIKTYYLERRRENTWSDPIALQNKSGSSLYYAEISTDWFGNERIELRVYVEDIAGNNYSRIKSYNTKFFFTTTVGLLITEIVVTIAIVGMFSAIRLTQKRRLKIVRRERFDVALSRSEMLAYLGEEAMFGFIAAFGQREGVSSILMWEPRLIGNFYQYLKELAEKANDYVSFVMQAKPQDIVSFVDFKIEEIGCSAITFAYPVSTLPQRWLSSLTLDQVPMGAGQGVLLLMLLMREKWTEISNDFQEEITDGMVELKDILLAGEDKDTILKKVREFRLFISGTVEVLDEIETEVDEVTDDIMEDFENEFLDADSSENSEEDTSQKNETDESSDKY